MFVKQTNKLSEIVWPAYMSLRGLYVCSRSSLHLFVCLRYLPRHCSSLGTNGQVVLRSGTTHACFATTSMSQAKPASYQLRSSCCASAKLSNVSGLSFPTELLAIENDLSFAAALARIAKNLNARCRWSGNLVWFWRHHSSGDGEKSPSVRSSRL